MVGPSQANPWANPTREVDLAMPAPRTSRIGWHRWPGAMVALPRHPCRPRVHLHLHLLQILLKDLPSWVGQANTKLAHLVLLVILVLLMVLLALLLVVGRDRLLLATSPLLAR